MSGSLTDIIARAGGHGLRLAALYEKPAFAKGGWRCSFSTRSDEQAPWFVGEGKTAEEATSRALAKAPKRLRDFDDIL